MMYNIITLTHIVRFLGGYHMITAKEARAKVDMLEAEKEGGQERKRVEEKINKAIEEGKSSCWIGFWVFSDTVRWLKSLGYYVEHSPAKCDTFVEW